MNTISKIALVFALISLFATTAVGGRDKRPDGPPPEAFSACEGKNSGDKAQFTSPHGDTVTGTCVMQDGKLVLHPDNPPKKK